MSAAHVALDALLSSDDPGAALGELLALAVRLPKIADTLPDHCRLADEWHDEESLPSGDPVWCRRDALNRCLLAEIELREDSYLVRLTGYAQDDERDSVVYRSSIAAAQAEVDKQLAANGWRLL